MLDGSGVSISIDRLDTSKGVSASRVVSVKSLVAGRMDVPFVVRKVLELYCAKLC